jgi:hypothetical protein
MLMPVTTSYAAKAACFSRFSSLGNLDGVPKPFAADEGVFKKCGLPPSVHDLLWMGAPKCSLGYIALEDRRHEWASIEHSAASRHWSGGIIGIFVRRLGAEGLRTWCKR